MQRYGTCMSVAPWRLNADPPRPRWDARMRACHAHHAHRVCARLPCSVSMRVRPPLVRENFSRPVGAHQTSRTSHNWVAANASVRSRPSLPLLPVALPDLKHTWYHSHTHGDSRHTTHRGAVPCGADGIYLRYVRTCTYLRSPTWAVCPVAVGGCSVSAL